MAILEHIGKLTHPALVRCGYDAGHFHETLGLDLISLAALTSHTLDESREWEGGHYPPDVRGLMMELDDAMTRTANKLVISIQEQLRDGTVLTAPLALLVFATDMDLWHYKPDFRPLPASVHTALVERCRAALGDLRVPSRAVCMDPYAYTQWLDGREDSNALRVAWANMQP